MLQCLLRTPQSAPTAFNTGHTCCRKEKRHITTYEAPHDALRFPIRQHPNPDSAPDKLQTVILSVIRFIITNIPQQHLQNKWQYRGRSSNCAHQQRRIELNQISVWAATLEVEASRTLGKGFVSGEHSKFNETCKLPLPVAVIHPLPGGSVRLPCLLMVSSGDRLCSGTRCQ